MPNQRFRLPEGGMIDRDRPLKFRFNGKDFSGYAGDTLASALLANGVRRVARSFKYHRHRGIYSAGEEEPSGLVEVGSGGRRTATCRPTLEPLVEGLTARSQTGWPGPNFDLGRVFDYTHALWPAGFYNKTFKWPGWHAWEGMVRALSGLGHAPVEPDPDHYEQVNAHCDLLVCGGGPAGLTAALAAGRSGARVILAEQDRRFGGCLNAERAELDGRPAGRWTEEVLAELESMPSVMLLPATTVSGIYDHGVTTLLQRGFGTAWRECLWTVRPRHVLLASGATEQGLVFPDNDRPGIMLAASMRQYLNRYAVAPGRTVVIATNNDSAYQTALDGLEHGLDIAAVIDFRAEVSAELRSRLEALDVPLLANSTIARTRGDRSIREVRVRSRDGGSGSRFRCDALAVSGGWSGRLHLLCHARGTLRFDPDTRSFLADSLPSGLGVTGSAAGIWNLAATLAHAEAAARRVCADLGLKPLHVWKPDPTHAPLEPGLIGAAMPEASTRRQWIDLAHDVTFADAELAVREGFDEVEHFKRYTTTGMSVDQGKSGNLNAFLMLATLTGRPVERIGTTTFRPPYLPITLGAVAGCRAGEGYATRRLLPAHAVHETLGARFEDYGWQRPDYYLRANERAEQAIRREVLAVRQDVGVFDNSPIGKIEVRGPDAAEFLNRVYMNQVHSLAVGRCRYGLMLNENGVIIDDGVFSRLADGHFLVNTTSGGAQRIFALLEELAQCDWPGLRVMLTDSTTHWANFTVAGPNAHTLLERLDLQTGLSTDALPHMSVATGSWNGEPLRIVRVSFSGEPSFEINVPAGQGAPLLSALLDAGQALGVTPYGVEALMILRLEKGYLHVGSDTDGQTSPDDVGWGQVARAKPDDFLGRRSLFRPANKDPERRQLVGIEPTDPRQRLQPGSHLLLGTHRAPPAPTDGWITSAALSPTLNRSIALALLRGGRQRLGEAVTIVDGDIQIGGRVVEPCFFDPRNERLRS